MAINSTGAALAHVTPRPTKELFGNNYLSFDSASGGGTFAAQFLPEIYEKEVERYGKRTINGFLRMVGAEMPLASDQVIWSEQGRLHVAYDAAESGASTVEVALLVELLSLLAKISNYSFMVLNTLKDLLESQVL